MKIVQPEASSCASGEADRAGVHIYAATATSAEPRPALPTSTTTRITADALNGRSACVVIIPPEGGVQSLDITPRRPDGSVDHGNRRDRLVESNLDRLRAVFADLKATTPGLNPLATLIRVKRAHPAPGRLTLVTSGIGTQEPLDLRQNGWSLDPSSTAAWLRAHNELPDLTGWTVDLLGVGDAGGKQAQPHHPTQVYLQRLWLAICTATGARCSVPDVITGSTWPTASNVVPPVPLPAPAVLRGRIQFSGALFELDRADLGQAIDVSLRDVVARVLGSGEHVVVTGRTDASGSAARNQKLSLLRARTIAARLIALGLPADQLTTVGAGSSGVDVAAERSDPRVAAQDRRVDITFTTSSSADRD